ncbi:MAG: adenine deaminase, partial [Bacteroidota bacterium]
VQATYIEGQKVSENGVSLIDTSLIQVKAINRFGITEIEEADLILHTAGTFAHPVIGCKDGQLITDKLILSPKQKDGTWQSDIENDVLKMVVVNRYHQAPVAIAFVHAFGLQSGAIASSVAHDSHNIVAVGVDDESLCRAINLVIKAKGGVSCVGNNGEHVLPLPIGGLMSADDGLKVAEAYTAIDFTAKALGSRLSAPFMSLSFMALLVIPHVKLSDKGLFDGDHFSFYQPLQN